MQLDLEKFRDVVVYRDLIWCCLISKYRYACYLIQENYVQLLFGLKIIVQLQYGLRKIYIIAILFREILYGTF